MSVLNFIHVVIIMHISFQHDTICDKRKSIVEVARITLKLRKNTLPRVEKRMKFSMHSSR